MAHISGGNTGLSKPKIDWPSKLVESLDSGSVQKTSNKKKLRPGFLIENVPGMLMKSLSDKELKLAKFTPRKFSNSHKAGTMLASLSLNSTSGSRIDATEFIARASDTDSAGSYAHPSLGGNESLMGVPEGLDAAREEKRKKEGSKAKKKPCPKKEGSKSKGHHRAECAKKRGHHSHHYMKGHHKEGSKGGHGYKGHHGGHGYKGHHGSSHHGGKHRKSPFAHVMHMKDKLNLSAEQIAKLRDAEFEFKKIAMRAKTEHKIAHLEMDRLVHSPTTNEKRLRELADIISQTKSKKIHAVVEAKIAILGILNPAQKQMVSDMHGSSHGHGHHHK